MLGRAVRPNPNLTNVWAVRYDHIVRTSHPCHTHSFPTIRIFRGGMAVLHIFPHQRQGTQATTRLACCGGPTFAMMSQLWFVGTLIAW